MKTIKLAPGERLVTNQLNRKGVLPQNIIDAARDIVANVRANGDAAVRDYCQRFDGVELQSFRLPQEQIDAALEGKHAGCYSRDVDALVFTDDDIDDYANMIEHGRPDLDFIQCREIASQAVTDWNDGHAMDGFTEFLYDYADEHAPAESVKQGGGIRH
ncbi:MAG: hypothetical protein BHV61_04715 [Collinsella sp. 60_9]|nr:MAG: hypothetical protein BHV61_04715 [Collinsella sp. 60_9]